MFSKRIILIGCLVVSLFNNSNAQTILDSAKSELNKINKVFDSSQYLGFDASIVYYTDTSYGHFERQEMLVEYFLNNRNYYYKVDGVEFVQNDSFSINVDHEEKNLVVTKNVNTNPSDRLFLKAFIDSSVNAYGSFYTIDIVTLDSSFQKISFTTTDTTQTYRYFSITYGVDDFFPKSMDFELMEKLEIEVPENSLLQPPPLTQKMQINFSNYKPLTSGSIFDENTYFIWNRTTKRYEPAEQFKYYRFLTAGLEQAELEDNPQLLVEQESNE